MSDEIIDLEIEEGDVIVESSAGRELTVALNIAGRKHGYLSYMDWQQILNALDPDVIVHFKHAQPLEFPFFDRLVDGLNRKWYVTSQLKDFNVVRRLCDFASNRILGNCLVVRCVFQRGFLLGTTGFLERVSRLFVSGYNVEVYSELPIVRIPPKYFIKTWGDAEVPEIPVYPFRPTVLDHRFLTKGSVPYHCDGRQTCISADGDIYPCYLASRAGLRREGVYRRGSVGESEISFEPQERCFLRCPYGYSKIQNFEADDS